MTNASTNEPTGETAATTLPIALRFDASGVIPVVAQDETSGAVLLLAYMNEEALRRTLADGVLTLWSRSRGRLWRKGEQSGNTLYVRELRVNCEENSLLARVWLDGPGACHEGYVSCFFRRLDAQPDGALSATVVEERAFDPAAVYALPPSPDAFERDCQALYAAYEWLRDTPERADSHTSRLLHAEDAEATVRHALARAREELGELHGVLDGTHTHTGDERDVILEASQVGYWAQLAAVAARLPYDAWAPHIAWVAAIRGDAAQEGQIEPPNEVAQTCAALVAQAGALCRAAQVSPERVVAADLASMRAKYGV